MKKIVTLIIVVASIIMLPVVPYLFAHHALEYIEMESFSISPPGSVLFHLHYDYYIEDSKQPGLDHWEITPGISYGITKFMMFDIHTHFAKFNILHVVKEKQAKYTPYGPSPMLEAAASSLQFAIYKSFINIGLVLTYELPFKLSRELLDGKDVFEFTFILDKSLKEHQNITLNLKGCLEDKDISWEWALGAKTPLTDDPHGPGAGIEFLGNIPSNEDSFEIFALPGIYLPLEEGIILKTGLWVNYIPDIEKSNKLRYNVTLLYNF